MRMHIRININVTTYKQNIHTANNKNQHPTGSGTLGEPVFLLVYQDKKWIPKQYTQPIWLGGRLLDSSNNLQIRPQHALQKHSRQFETNKFAFQSKCETRYE